MHDPTSLNRYLYAGDDPVNVTDPSGMSTKYDCFFLTNLELDLIAWSIILGSGVVMALSLFLDGTIIGLPAGAVLGALGFAEHVSGWFYLWYFDKYFPNGAWVCIPTTEVHIPAAPH